MTDDMQRAREKFEAWLSPYWSREGDTDEDGDFVYRDEWVQGAWVGYRAALLAAPEGFVLVPVVPTPEMMQAACECGAYPGMNDWWLAMLAARPQGVKDA